MEHIFSVATDRCLAGDCPTALYTVCSPDSIYGNPGWTDNPKECQSPWTNIHASIEVPDESQRLQYVLGLNNKSIFKECHGCSHATTGPTPQCSGYVCIAVGIQSIYIIIIVGSQTIGNPISMIDKVRHGDQCQCLRSMWNIAWLWKHG
jgi:hypothetical protein